MPVQEGAGRGRAPGSAMPGDNVAPVYIINTCFGAAGDAPAGTADKADAVERTHDCGLSMRAMNVLKLLAGEITGETPPREQWVPPDALLRKITVERLSIARNCGPRTVDEIVHWAGRRGVTIQPPFRTGRSLADTWRSLNARHEAGELTRVEIAAALEKSVRRKSTKIPVVVQRILLQFLGMMGDGGRRP